MPFAVFRRHQKKMLAVFGILAMFGFVLSDSLFKMGSQPANRDGNTVVVDLFGKPVYKSDLREMAEKRSVANRFALYLTGNPATYGGLGDREIVDALVIKHEADRLGIPETSEFATDCLRQQTGGRMNQAQFELVRRQLGLELSGEQILACLASELRLVEARKATANPVVTPLDVFQSYRDQQERSAFHFVSFPATNFLDKTGEPSAAAVAALYEKGKDLLPDPLRPAPGFKVPREVKLEILSIDGEVLAKSLVAKIPESEVRAAYDARKSTEYTIPSELPTDLFQDDPTAKLTPAQLIPFDEVKDSLALALARERAAEEIVDKFDRIKVSELDKFSDAYAEAATEIADAKARGETTKVTLPKPTRLDALAKTEGLAHEVTPLLSAVRAISFGQISDATVGLNPAATGGQTFAEAVFAPRSNLFDSMDFVDRTGRRYLVRKLEDVEAHVPPLAEIKPEVVLAWKSERAKDLAKAAAKTLAARIEKDGGKLPEGLVDGRPVNEILAVPKLQPGFPNGRDFQMTQPVPTTLSQIPNASDALREAIFGLKPGSVAVETDLPGSTAYVFTLERREPATFTGLYGSAGSSLSYMRDAFTTAVVDDSRQRIADLRIKAGIPAGWIPPDERDRDKSETTSEG